MFGISCESSVLPAWIAVFFIHGLAISAVTGMAYGFVKRSKTRDIGAVATLLEGVLDIIFGGLGFMFVYGLACFIVGLCGSIVLFWSCFGA